MALPDRRLDGARIWRLDLAVLADDAVKETLRAGVKETLSGARDPSQEWDSLKAQWQRWARECGRNARLRLTYELNETLRKIRILKAGAPLTPTTREYLGILRARYDRIFLQTTQKVLTRFGEYARLSGAKLNMNKSSAMVLGNSLQSSLPHDLQIATRLRILGITFDKTGVAPDVWEELSREVTDSTQRAMSFNFSFAEKAYLIKCVFLARVFYVSRIEFPPEAVLKALDRAVFSFFWDGKTERLQRDALRLPRNLGGFGLPCIGTTAQLLALKTVLGILDDVGAPARPLVMFFLGPQRRVLVPRALGNLCPSAEHTPPYYKALVALSRELTAMDPDLDPREIAPVRLCGQLVSTRGTLRSPPPTFPWPELTTGRLSDGNACGYSGRCYLSLERHLCASLRRN
ncbi:hypothetical protein MRX96_006887 [Rhipicephalus microplus]